MTTLEATRFDVEQGVATLTLDRPAQRNALDMTMRREIARHVATVRADPDIRALVLAGAGGAFCAGGDIKNFGAEMAGAAWRARMHELQAWAEQLITLDKPVVAAVDGAAYGAGFGIALAADFILASPRARFCLSFMRLGLVPDCGSWYTLPRWVGVQRAKELMLSARELGAAEAQALGLVLEVHGSEALLPRAQALAASFVAASPLAVSLTKRALNAVPGASVQTMLEMEANAQALAFGSAEHRSAVAAFRQSQKEKK